MKKLTVVAIVAACLTAPAFGAAIIYGVNSGGDLYSISVTGSTFTPTNLGAITGVTGTMTDIAELNGTLYLITDTDLYSLNSSTLAATEIGAFGGGVTEMDALTFGSNGTLYGVQSGTSTDYYTINTSTGAATAHAVTGATGGINAAGDLEVVGTTLYITTGGTTGDSSLGEVNLTNGDFTNLGEIETGGGTKFTEVYGLAIANGELYGFTGDGDILEFSSTSPGSATVTELTAPEGFPDFYGTTDNQVSGVPEPGTLSLLGLGLLGMGGLTRRRKA